MRLILFVLVATVYYASAAGINGSNDGSHYALLRAMTDEGRFRITTYQDYTQYNDYSLHNGLAYSDRPPGTALLTLPAAAAAKILPDAHPMPSRHDAENLKLAYVLLVPALVGAALVVLLHHTLLAIGLSDFSALTTALTFAFGTTAWRYGSMLFSHIFAGLLVLAAVALTLQITRRGQVKPTEGAILGFVAGLSVVVEYSNALFFTAICIYMAATLPRRLIGRGALAFISGAALPVGFLMVYNAINFGGPFTTSYRYVVSFEWARHFSTTFNFPLVDGLPGVLWYGADDPAVFGIPNQGVFLLMPVAFIGWIGLWPYVRQRGREAILVLGVLVMYLLLFATHRTFSAGTSDTRYLMPFLALWFIPVAYGIQVIERITADNLKTLLLFGVYGLIFLSVRNIMTQIVFFYNYGFNIWVLQIPFEDNGRLPFIAPRNWAYILDTLFPNQANLPLLWIVLAVGLAAGYGFKRGRT